MVKLEFHTRTQTESRTLQRELSFQDICPNWSKKLRNGMDEIDRMILARDSKYCVVGEAWGFTGKQTGYFIAPLIPVVGCWTCIVHGRKFGFIAKKKESSSNSFEPLVAEFLAHWNKLHQNITLKNRR